MIPEAVSPNQQISSESYQQDLRENVTALSLVADLLFDHGTPHITEKSTYLTLLEKASTLSKAQGYIVGSYMENTSHSRLCA